MTTVVLNGASRELDARATVADAVDATGVAPGRAGIAVAVDGEIVPRGQWERTPLDDGQRVEVLQAAQGGA